MPEEAIRGSYLVVSPKLQDRKFWALLGNEEKRKRVKKPITGLSLFFLQNFNGRPRLHETHPTEVGRFR